mmetsp:Transcript_3482/g.8276  ORF Transcript_3482/g.8276 Transcript_3482/m.8276 type:complete len:1163 (-) Transcript_3482:200-3688(-)
MMKDNHNNVISKIRSIVIMFVVLLGVVVVVLPSFQSSFAPSCCFVQSITIDQAPSDLIGSSGNTSSSEEQHQRTYKSFETRDELQQAVDDYLRIRQQIARTASAAGAASAPTSSASASVPTDTAAATTTTTTAQQQLLSGEKNVIRTYGPIGEWNVSQIENFGTLFSFRRNELTALFVDENVDLSRWDTSRATNTQDMFLGCQQMDMDFSNWQVDRVTKFNGMFEGCTKFQGIGLSNWQVVRGQLFQSMFSRVMNLSPTQFDISSWKPWNAQTMDNMFRDSNFGSSSSSGTDDSSPSSPGNLCAWYQYLPTTVSTKDMFLRSQCPDQNDPDVTLLQQQEQAQLTTLSFCHTCDQINSEPSSSSSSAESSSMNRPNVLFIMTDQQRFDSIRWIQDRLPWYNDNENYGSGIGNGTQFKIDTPNIDALLKSGAYFDNAYTQCAVCAPARTTLRTGCTIERHGVQENDLYKYYERGELFKDRVKNVRSIDQILVEDLGYTSEYYGKWHIPKSLGESRDGSGRRVISFNDFEYDTQRFSFRDDPESKRLRRYLEYFEEIGTIPSPDAIEEGQQIDPFSRYPYDPISLDSRVRYNSPTNTALTGRNGFDEMDASQGNVMGLYSLSKDYTPTHFTGDIATRALRRLQKQDKPWFLTMSLHSPHPPFVPSWEFLEKYWDQRSNLHVPRNLDDDLKDSNYASIRNRIPEYGDLDKVQELTAIYYALVEEVDAEVGAILAALEREQANNTLIVFTADHGEMLGSHGKREKSNFYEEASKIPLMFSFPGMIKEGTVIDEKVSNLDIFATILDYINATELDGSDGTSLRPMIENRVINEERDQDVAFGEWDFRMPTNPGSDTLSRRIDDRPTNLVRKGSYKLMLHKSSTSDEFDMMFDLSSDPFEMNNLIGMNGMTANDETVSKAEHMRCLLLEWMKRLDGADRYFSDPGNNYFEGDGDITEIWRRQSWNEIGFWVSDTVIPFGRMAYDGTQYVRHEWIYMGTRMPGLVSVTSITIMGSDAAFFQVDRDSANIEFGDCIPIRVTFTSQEDVPSDRNLDAYLVISAEGSETKYVQLHGGESSTRPDALQSRTSPPQKPDLVEDGSVSVCHVCPESQCLQRPYDIYPVDGMTITCNDIEVGGKHLLTPISVESCTSLQTQMSSGTVCGGCGSDGCV